MTENSVVSLVCPVCKSTFEGESHTEAVCPVCGNTADTDKLYEAMKSSKAQKSVAVYRLMSSADAFFSKKSYDEAYTSYNAVIDADPSCEKAIFRRELTSQYLTQESSAVYLSCDSFFGNLETLKKEARPDLFFSKEYTRKLGLTIHKDVLDFISVRADYEKKFSDIGGNSQAADIYITELMKLLEYTKNIMLRLMEGMDESCERDKAYTVLKCLDTGNKLYGMLLKGADYTEIPEGESMFSADGSVRDCAVKRSRMLSAEETAKADSCIDSMREAREDMLKVISDELYKEIKEAGSKNSAADKKKSRSEEFSRSEYDQWHERNKKEYYAADKRMVIFSIIGKALAVFAIVMLAMFIIGVIFDDEMYWTLITSLVFFAVHAAFMFLRRFAAKKKNFYTEVLERGSSTLRAGSSSFDV